jgi:branched-chain amino acid transport system substrate-binding protein
MPKILLCVALTCLLWMSPVLGADPIPIGVFLSLTGGVASYGQMGWAGISAAHKIEPEVLGRPIELKREDTASDKQQSANAVLKLIEREKVPVIIGEMISSNTIAGAENAERAGVPMVSPTATNPMVTQGKKFVFRVCFIDPDQGRVGAKMALDVMKAKTAAVIFDVSQDYCVALAQFFKTAYTKGGGKVVAESMFKSGDKDFTPQLSHIKAANPDIIYAPIYYTELALMAKQAKEMGLKTPILSSDGAHAPELIQLGGAAVEGIHFTDHFHEGMVTTEKGKKFIELYKKEHGREIDAFTAMAGEAYFVVVDAIRRAGSTDPKKIRDAIAQTKDFDGVSGKLTINAEGNADKPMVINKVENGKFVYVTTVNP